MFATSPSTIMEAAFGRLHNNGGVEESIMVDGGVANIGKAYANMHMFMCLCISHIFPYLPYDVSGAIYLPRSAAPYKRGV